MSKRTTTRWYIGAWVLWLIALLVALVLRHSTGGRVSASLLFLGLVMVATAGVMLVTWLGALVKLGSQRAWGWFASVLLFGLIGLGIVGMVTYALTGPEDIRDVAIRPATT